MAVMKNAGAATARSTVTMGIFLLLLSWDTVQGRELTRVDKKISVTINTNMTVKVHAKIPGNDTDFTTTIYPGTTTLRIPFPHGTDLKNLSFPMEISVDPMQIMGVPVTAAANSTIMVVPNTIVDIQGFLTEILNTVLGLIPVYFKMLVTAVPPPTGSGIPPISVPIPVIVP